MLFLTFRLNVLILLFELSKLDILIFVIQLAFKFGDTMESGKHHQDNYIKIGNRNYSTRHKYWRQCILKLTPLASKCHKLKVSSSFRSKDMAFHNISVINGHCQLNIAQWASQRKFEIHGVF